MIEQLACHLMQYDSHDDWEAARVHTVGASDLRAILGQGYAGESYLSKWEEKTGRHKPEFTEEISERLKVGQLIEPALFDMFADATGMSIEEMPQYSTLVSKDHEFISATPDGFVLDEDGKWGVLELKNVDLFQASDWNAGEVPMRHQIQVQHQLLVTGLSFGWTMALVGGVKRVPIRVERHDGFIETALQVINEFWRHVCYDEMPEPSGPPEADEKVLNRVYADAIDDEVFADVCVCGHARNRHRSYACMDETRKSNGAWARCGCKGYLDALDHWSTKYLASRDIQTQAEKAKKEAANHIRKIIGHYKTGITPSGRKVKWSEVVVTQPAREAKTYSYRRLYVGKLDIPQ